MNVFLDEAWACHYSDFPIWSFRNGKECNIPTKLRGTTAIAVKQPFVLAAGGYQEDRDRVILLKLEEHSSHVINEWRLPLDLALGSDSYPYPYPPLTMIDGRGDELHVVQNGEWLRWRVNDFVESK